MRSPSLPIIDVTILSPLPGTITCYELRSQAESSHVEGDNLEKRDSSAPTPHDTTMILYTEFSISSTLASSARSDLILTSRMIYGYEHWMRFAIRDDCTVKAAWRLQSAATSVCAKSSLLSSIREL